MNPSYNVKFKQWLLTEPWSVGGSQRGVKILNYIRELRELVGTRPIIMAGACVILIDDEERLLLQQRTDNGLWGLPGGSMEPGENMKELQAGNFLKR